MKIMIKCPDCDNTIILDFAVDDCHNESYADGDRCLVALAKGERKAGLGKLIQRGDDRAMALARRSFCKMFPEHREALCSLKWQHWVQSLAPDIFDRCGVESNQ